MRLQRITQPLLRGSHLRHSSAALTCGAVLHAAEPAAPPVRPAARRRPACRQPARAPCGVGGRACADKRCPCQRRRRRASSHSESASTRSRPGPLRRRELRCSALALMTFHPSLLEAGPGRPWVDDTDPASCGPSLSETPAPGP